jgi:Tol biopolymer transport system component
VKTTFIALALFAVTTCAVAATGPFTTKIAFASDRDGNSEVFTMLPNGSGLQRLSNHPANDTHPSFSSDGQKIVFTSDRDGNNEIYIMDTLNGTDQRRLTFHPGTDAMPALAPDGKNFVHHSNRGGNFDIFLSTIGGAGSVALTNDPGNDTEPSFSPKGDKIAFVSTRDGNPEIYVMTADGNNETRLTNNGLTEARPRFSHDGRRIVFARRVFGSSGFDPQVVVMNADGTGATVLTTLGANSNPEFSGDDKQIFFNSSRDGNNEIYSMNLDGSNQVRLTSNAAADIAPSTQDTFEIETASFYRPSTFQWFLRDKNVAGAATITVSFGGQPGHIPVTGDWDGDGRTDIGFFLNGKFFFALLKTTAARDTSIQLIAPVAFGQAGDLPVAGDWDGDGIDDVGVFRPSVSRFFLRRPVQVSDPFPQTVFFTVSFAFGQAGDLPLAGDWDGDGADSVGVFRPTDPGLFLLSNSFDDNEVDFSFVFGGNPGELPVAGDWFAAGRDGVGLFIPGIPVTLLAPELSSKPVFAISSGAPGDIPVSGSFAP